MGQKQKPSASRSLNPDDTQFKIEIDQFSRRKALRQVKFFFFPASDLPTRRPTLHKSRMHTGTCCTGAETFDLPFSRTDAPQQERKKAPE